MISSSLIWAGLTRNNEVVYDSATGLYWQDNIEAKTTEKKWVESIIYCENLNLNAHNDWRLPNKNELINIVDYTVYSPAMNDVFQNITSSCYWSSTTDASITDYAWDVNFHYGSTYYYFKSYSCYVRCVRGGQ
jgi:hypothetical protein